MGAGLDGVMGVPKARKISCTILALAMGSGSSRSMRSLSFPANLMCLFLYQLDDAHGVKRRIGFKTDDSHMRRSVYLGHAIVAGFDT